MQNYYKDLLSEYIKNPRGKLVFNKGLARFTWLKVGGNADVLFVPKDERDLCHFLLLLPEKTPITVLGNSSNILIRDGGLSGVTIRFGKHFSFIKIDGERISVGAGAACLNIARQACLAGLGGLEFLSGIPGTAGGALRMNAGAFGKEVKDIFLSAKVVDKDGQSHAITRESLSFSYRNTNLNSGYLISEVSFLGRPADKKKIAKKMADFEIERRNTQPIKNMTGGSTFKNPSGEKAWRLIDDAGCRGMKHGGAMVSELHCNFLINAGTATASDLEELGIIMHEKVLLKTGVSLDWEIQRLGDIHRDTSKDNVL